MKNFFLSLILSFDYYPSYIITIFPNFHRYIRIDGKTNPEQRKHQIDKFQEQDDYLAAILSITAANAGVTLTAANLVVFTELFWNPGVINIHLKKHTLILYI